MFVPLHQLRRAACLIPVLLLTAWWPHAAPGAAGPEAMLEPPPSDGPVVVRATFQLLDINDIDDDQEAFEFTGFLMLEWNDPRQVFDPAEAGCSEKVYQGNYQFSEIAPSWYPQVVLANQSGLFQSDAVILRVRPDGSSTLVQNLNAVAETDLDMRLYPFDAHRLELKFEVLGFDRSEVVLEAGSSIMEPGVSVSQWDVVGIGAESRTHPSLLEGPGGKVSALVIGVDVERRPFFMLRLVVLPLILIVALSWSVFWMERSSLGDRIAVSFIGILTAVAYQMVVGDVVADVSYFTLMHAFLNLSMIVMCLTVVVNLVVGVCDKHDRHDLGDLIDYRCRWLFPLGYFALLALTTIFAFVFFQ